MGAMLKLPPISRLWRLAAVVPFLFAAVSCSTTGPVAGNTPGVFAGQPAGAENPWTAVSWWDDGGASGPGHIVVDLDRQVATFYRGENAIGVAAISSGVDGRNTPAGQYKILEKIRDKHSNAYGHVEDASGKVVNNDATPRSPVPPGGKYVPSPMPFWMRLTNSGIGMHQGFLPGYAASHGCIRMDKKVVQQFYNAATVGMPVKVIRTN
jgi:lipoprotein-anchoring transpeptidase ErfK/SrfK